MRPFRPVHNPRNRISDGWPDITPTFANHETSHCVKRDVETSPVAVTVMSRLDTAYRSPSKRAVNFVILFLATTLHIYRNRQLDKYRKSTRILHPSLSERKHRVLVVVSCCTQQVRDVIRKRSSSESKPKPSIDRLQSTKHDVYVWLVADPVLHIFCFQQPSRVSRYQMCWFNIHDLFVRHANIAQSASQFSDSDWQPRP